MQEIIKQFEFFIIILLSAAGGIVRELVSSDVNKSITRFIGESFISVFVGITVYFFLYGSVPQNILICAVALCGYLGTSILDYLTKFLKNTLKRLFGEN